jgi:hypothetical protein
MKGKVRPSQLPFGWLTTLLTPLKAYFKGDLFLSFFLFFFFHGTKNKEFCSVGLTSLSNASFLQGKYPTERLSTIESSPTNNRLLLYGSKVRGQGRSSDVKQLKASTYENAKIKSIESLASYAASRVSMVIKFLDPL